MPLRCAFRLCVVCVLVCVFDTRRLRFAFVRSGRTPKVSCSLNGTRAKIVNFHLVSGNAKLSFEGKDCVSKLTPAIKDVAITELCGPAATQLCFAILCYTLLCLP